jgi:hypothetical protein
MLGASTPRPGVIPLVYTLKLPGFSELDRVPSSVLLVLFL